MTAQITVDIPAVAELARRLQALTQASASVETEIPSACQGQG